MNQWLDIEDTGRFISDVTFIDAFHLGFQSFVWYKNNSNHDVMQKNSLFGQKTACKKNDVFCHPKIALVSLDQTVARPLTRYSHVDFRFSNRN